MKGFYVGWNTVPAGCGGETVTGGVSGADLIGAGVSTDMKGGGWEFDLILFGGGMYGGQMLNETWKLW